jgi:hypothetical protein
MKRMILHGCLRATLLLLCLLVFGLLGCGSMKNGNNEVLKDVAPLFQVAVRESDFLLFNERIQQLGLIAVDFQPARVNGQNGEVDAYWITFKFLNRNSFLAGSSAIMSTGVAHQISYQY